MSGGADGGGDVRGAATGTGRGDTRVRPGVTGAAVRGTEGTGDTRRGAGTGERRTGGEGTVGGVAVAAGRSTFGAGEGAVAPGSSTIGRVTGAVIRWGRGVSAGSTRGPVGREGTAVGSGLATPGFGVDRRAGPGAEGRVGEGDGLPPVPAGEVPGRDGAPGVALGLDGRTGAVPRPLVGVAREVPDATGVASGVVRAWVSTVSTGVGLAGAVFLGRGGGVLGAGAAVGVVVVVGAGAGAGVDRPVGAGEGAAVEGPVAAGVSVVPGRGAGVGTKSWLRDGRSASPESAWRWEAVVFRLRRRSRL